MIVLIDSVGGQVWVNIMFMEAVQDDARDRALGDGVGHVAVGEGVGLGYG